jgi:5'-AMP-activated protein kinase, regulatory beta subunit
MVSVRQSDFEVFQALAKDSEDTGNSEMKDYSQDIPQAKPWEKVNGPPILPPHLLQVILNKDTPLSCEPTLVRFKTFGLVFMLKLKFCSAAS